MRQAPALISLLLVSLLLLGNLGTAEAVLGPAVGAAGNVWAPYGPFAKSLQFKFYAGAFGAFGAFSDFGSGNLDLVDAPATPGVAAGCLGLGDWTLSPPDPVTGFQTCALTDVGGLVNGLGVAGRGIGGYANFWTALYGRNNPLFVPADPLYTFGGGTTTMRWGLRSGVTSLNPFHAATVSELTVLREIYDSVFKASPVEPSKVFCWMCNSYEIRIGPTGNTHFTIHLKSTIRWHDVALSPFGASDVKFTLLNFRDVPVASTALLADVAPVISVTLLSPNDLDLEMLGVDTPMCSVTYSCLLDRLARVPIIPKDIWGLPGGPPFFYGDVPAADPAVLRAGRANGMSLVG